MNHVESALETYKVMPLQVILFRDLREGVGTLPCSAHEFFLGRWGVADAAIYFHSHQLEVGTGRKTGRENLQGLLDGVRRRLMAFEGSALHGVDLSARLSVGIRGTP